MIICHKIRSKNKGFTLLELLIVIAIIAVLSVILILVLDPAETLRKSRDSQRIADLNTLKTALGIWTTTTSTPYLGGAATNSTCKTGTTSTTAYVQGASKVFYSVGVDIANIASGTTALVDGSSGNSASSSQASVASGTLTNGTGWVPVNLDSLTGGSPISNLPLDPTNSVTAAAPVNNDPTYRYVCNASTTKWEADSNLESTTYTVQDNKESKDGGNNSNYYEVGTDLKLLGTGTNF